MTWTLARRASRLNPSTIREILKITERPGIISLAGGLPSADGFPVEAMAEACAKVLRDSPREALQYAASEGYAPLREWVAAEMSGQGVRADPGQVLITTGSQQGLDLVGKVLVDPGCEVAVESPTYLGALQAFSPYEAEFISVQGDDEGPLPEALDAARGARFMYLLPNFQNPTGRVLPAARRQALVASGSVSGDELTRAQNAFEAATAQLAAAKAGTAQAAANLKSAANAKHNPAPIACPLTAAITGTSRSRIASQSR